MSLGEAIRIPEETLGTGAGSELRLAGYCRIDQSLVTLKTGWFRFVATLQKLGSGREDFQNIRVSRTFSMFEKAEWVSQLSTSSSAISPAREFNRGLQFQVDAGTNRSLSHILLTGYAPEASGLHSILLTSSYQVRIPSAPEIFYDDKFAPRDPATGKKGDTPPMLGTQARHTIDTTVTYMFVKWAGLSFEHTYGSLPPAFSITGHSFKVGLTFTLRQTSFGRYSILKPSPLKVRVVAQNRLVDMKPSRRPL